MPSAQRTVALAALLATCAAAPTARAAAEPADEWGLVVLEFLGASAAGALTIAGVYQAGDSLLDLEPRNRDRLVMGWLAVVPAVEGLTVCAIGRLSKHYRGRCAWTVLGAYAAAVPFVPLAFLVGSGQPDAIGQGIVTAGILGLGFVLAAPVGATVGWNVTRTPYTGALLETRPRLAEALPRRPVAGRGPAGLTLPILALRF